jgi:tetratricopeptide (TPR) repeat protein
MVLEKELNEAMDLYADGKEAESEALLDRLTERLKELRIKAKQPGSAMREVDVLLSWALCLVLLQEYEQALLKYEEALKLDPANDEIVWEMAQLFLYQLHKPDSAKALLEERLLKNSPDNEEYQDAFRLAKMAFAPEETEEIVIDPEKHTQVN